MGCHALLQGIFLTQRSNLCLSSLNLGGARAASLPEPSTTHTHTHTHRLHDTETTLVQGRANWEGFGSNGFRWGWLPGISALEAIVQREGDKGRWVEGLWV